MRNRCRVVLSVASSANVKDDAEFLRTYASQYGVVNMIDMMRKNKTQWGNCGWAKWINLIETPYQLLYAMEALPKLKWVGVIDHIVKIRMGFLTRGPALNGCLDFMYCQGMGYSIVRKLTVIFLNKGLEESVAKVVTDIPLEESVKIDWRPVIDALVKHDRITPLVSLMINALHSSNVHVLKCLDADELFNKRLTETRGSDVSGLKKLSKALKRYEAEGLDVQSAIDRIGNETFSSMYTKTKIGTVVEETSTEE